MPLKKTFASLALLLAVTVLAGCTSLLPTLPGQPPVDTAHGTVDISVDLTELHDAAMSVDGVAAHLVSGARTITEELDITGDVAAVEVHAVPTGHWQSTVSLYDGDVQVASKTHAISVHEGKSTPIAMITKVDGDTVTLVIDDGTDPGDGDDDPQPPTITREVFYIQSGSRTETRTEVYVIRSSEPGPTVMLVGGVHGSERSGWMVAGEVARDWDIDRGTLVVLPEANKDAVNRRSRTGRDGRDLNRAFPRNRAIDRPTDWLMAQRIWDVVLEYQPEALLDLHEGWGLREAGDRFPGGTLSVGQTLIVHPAGDAEQFARHVVNVLNTEHNPFYGRNGYTYNFQIIGPPVDGSLARKAGNDLGIPAFIAEPTQGRAGRHQTTLEQRQRWHRVFVEEFLRWYGLLD